MSFEPWCVPRAGTWRCKRCVTWWRRISTPCDATVTPSWTASRCVEEEDGGGGARGSRKRPLRGWSLWQDPDVSIRRRALDLVYALVDDDNVQFLAGEMINYLVRPCRRLVSLISCCIPLPLFLVLSPGGVRGGGEERPVLEDRVGRQAPRPDPPVGDRRPRGHGRDRRRLHEAGDPRPPPLAHLGRE